MKNWKIEIYNVDLMLYYYKVYFYIVDTVEVPISYELGNDISVKFFFPTVRTTDNTISRYLCEINHSNDRTKFTYSSQNDSQTTNRKGSSSSRSAVN